MTDSRLLHPSVQRIARVAGALGHLADDIVFVGGAIAPLLHTDPPFDQPRPTKDVDAVVASTSYTDLIVLHENLRQRGFRQDPMDRAHLHRWRSPEADLLDLVPAGQHAGGSGQLWDRIALETSVRTELADGLSIRHASAPAFLALKWAAYVDRGTADPMNSHDLEDIFAVVAARPALVDEVRAAPAALAAYVAMQVQSLLARGDRSDLLAGHLNNVQEPARIRDRVVSALRALADGEVRSS